MTKGAQDMLRTIFDQLKLSARSYDRLIKVSRTIADLESSSTVTDRHIAEALQFKNNTELREL